jgi:hypothetical protein
MMFTRALAEPKKPVARFVPEETARLPGYPRYDSSYTALDLKTGQAWRNVRPAGVLVAWV